MPAAADAVSDDTRGFPKRRAFAWLGSLGLMLAALALALLLGELGLRSIGQSYYWAIAKRPDPVLGWRPPADSAAWQGFEGGALVRTNALGFRDRDHAVAKPPGRVRIAVLGDSFTEAVQVPVEQTWWRVMEDWLNGGNCPLAACTAARDSGEANCGAREFEALNFAVSGYSTAQSLLAWRMQASRFAPDVVVLAFFIGNDLTENERTLDAEPLRPYLRPASADSVRGARPLVLDDAFRHSSAYREATASLGRGRQWLLEHSRIAQLLVQARDAARVRDVPPVDTGHASGEPHEPGVDNDIYRVPTTVAWRRAWEATEAMLAAFASEVRAAGARPILLLIGTGAQVHPDAAASAGFAEHIGVYDLGYPVRRLLAVAAKNDLAVVNLPAVMAVHARSEGVLLHGFPGGWPGFGHWNAAGHAVAGEAAARLVCEALRSGPPHRKHAKKHR